MAQTDGFDVIISGYGLAGQTAASLLARLGHRVCVFEKHRELYGQPRLGTIDGETPRIIQAAGDIEVAFRSSPPCERFMFVNEADELLIDIDWSGEHISGYPIRTAMYQPDVEEAVDAAARRRGVELRKGWEIFDVEHDADGVVVSARERLAKADDQWLYGAEQRVAGKLLIGADGARSSTRDRAGIEMENLGFESAWLSVDAYRKGDLPTKHRSEDMRVPVIMMAPEGRARAFIPIGDRRLRFEFWVDPDSEHQEKLNPEVGYAELERYWDLTKDDVEIYRTVVYPFKSKLAERFRDGRVFLAGDAAHLMNPFLGQGACSAWRDAINLAWKLDLVLGGIADPALLDTYEDERRAHARAYVVASSDLGEAALELDPVKAAERDERLKQGDPLAAVPHPVLTSGILQRSENGEVELPIGDVGPQGTVSYKGQTGRFDDVVGWGFQLILRDHAPRDVLDDAQRELLQRIRCFAVGFASSESDGVVADVGGSYGRYFDDHQIEALLLRPDFVVFGVLHSIDGLSRMIEDLATQLGLSVPEPGGEAPLSR